MNDQKEKISSIEQLNDQLNIAREKYLEDRLDYEMIKNDNKHKVENLEMEL